MNGIPDCIECIHYDKNPMDNPCFHCLDGYNGRPDFKRKSSKIDEKRVILSENEPLPWSQP